MPAKHKKTQECICPKCGSDHTVVDDWDMDIGCMTYKMCCEDCDYSWREYFAVAYDGFSDETGEYDSNGVCLTEGNE